MQRKCETNASIWDFATILYCKHSLLLLVFSFRACSLRFGIAILILWIQYLEVILV